MRYIYDVGVVGLGAMGSAAAYHLASKGLKVIGLDQFAPPHDLGSSHGETRIIRAAYAEGPHYVQILLRAYELWTDLQENIDGNLLVQTGGIFVGGPASSMVDGAEKSAKIHSLKYDRISSSEIKSRWGHFNPDHDMDGVYDPEAGVLFPEICIQSHLDLARNRGANIQFGKRVKNWEASPGSVKVSTQNEIYEVGTLILTAGAWINNLLVGFKSPFDIQRQTLFWFDPAVRNISFHPDDCPIYVWDVDGGTHYYGFPDFGSGIKVGCMYNGAATDPDSLDREVGYKDEYPIRNFLRRYMPMANGNLASTAVCMFTNTPDLDFVLDHHPEHSNVLIASPCSGHGFKFSSAIGEILANMTIRNTTDFEMDKFKLSRFNI